MNRSRPLAGAFGRVDRYIIFVFILQKGDKKFDKESLEVFLPL